MNREQITTVIKARGISAMLSRFASHLLSEIHYDAIEDPKRFIGQYDELGRLAICRDFEKIINRYYRQGTKSHRA